MNSKVLTAILAIALIMVPVAMMSESEAAEDSNGNVNVYVYTSANSFTMDTVQAFDIYQAIMAADNVTATAAQGDDLWYYDAGGYTDINATYGTLAYIGTSSIEKYDIYISDGDGWTLAQPALGWYRPYSDYASTVTFDEDRLISAGASNVAIIPSGVVPSVPTGEYELKTLTQVDGSSEYRYTFFIQDKTGSVTIDSVSVRVDVNGEDESRTIGTSDLQAGITIVGYGSDAYLALMNALGNNLAGQTRTVIEVETDDYTYYTYYSWMESIFGAGTETIYGDDSTTYIYWASYTSGNIYLSYTLGYYSGLDGAPNNCMDFKIIYECSTY